MITHVVIFRAQCDAHKQIILEEAKKLEAIETLDSFTCGTALPSDRPVVDDTFAAGLVATFKTQSDMDTYAVHPIHMKFYENCLNKYKVKVQVFDINA